MSQSSDDVATSDPTFSPGSPVSPESAPQDKITNRHTTSDSTLTQECLDFTLNFLSTSSNETLLCVFALLAIVTYIILGRIGLLIIGVALGVVLHASWEGPALENKEDTSRVFRKRRELALEVSKRLLDWPTRAELGDSSEVKSTTLAPSDELSAMDLEYATFQPATAAALKTITNAVIGDYVK